MLELYKGEHKDPNEDEDVKNLVKLTQEQMHEQDGKIRRGQHAKSTGCVKAKFIIDESAPKIYPYGIFKTPGSFDAVVRFSNSQGTIEKDKEGAARGVAIKLSGVDGEGAMSEAPSGSQDFLMVNHPVFPFSNPAEYLAVIRRRNIPLVGSALVLSHLLLEKLRGDSAAAVDIVSAIRHDEVASPLEETYWSGSPYWLGEPNGSAGCAVKYLLVPKGITTPAERPKDPEGNYLRTALVNHLNQRDAELYFKVQKQTDAMPIEDASIRWDENASVPQAVAILRIPKQTEAEIAALEKECEQLSFHPWHALAAHKPMGGINRLRKAVYNKSFQTRSPAPSVSAPPTGGP